MARCLLLLALLAVSASLAAAQIRLCDPNKAPAAPMNPLITANAAADGGKAQISMSWRNGVKSNSDGCVDAYQIEVVDKKLQSVSRSSANGGPNNEQNKHTITHPGGNEVTVRITPLFNGKKGATVDVGTIKTAGGFQGVQPL